MSKEMQLFKFKNKEVRILAINGEPWFIGQDISESLGYSRPSVMYRAIDEEDKLEINPYDYDIPDILDNTYKMIIVSESGLFSAIFGSQLKTAKKFKRWVTSEVLPSLRKSGMYIPDEIKDRILRQTEKILELESSAYRLQAGANEEHQKLIESMNKVKLENIQLITTIKKKELKITCKMPLNKAIKDVKYFLKDYVREESDCFIDCDKLYEKYCAVRRHRDINILIFEQIVSDFHFKINKYGIEYWRDIVFK